RMPENVVNEAGDGDVRQFGLANAREVQEVGNDLVRAGKLLFEPIEMLLDFPTAWTFAGNRSMRTSPPSDCEARVPLRRRVVRGSRAFLCVRAVREVR